MVSHTWVAVAGIASVGVPAFGVIGTGGIATCTCGDVVPVVGGVVVKFFFFSVETNWTDWTVVTYLRENAKIGNLETTLENNQKSIVTSSYADFGYDSFVIITHNL